jgi:hypothetical protein
MTGTLHRLLVVALSLASALAPLAGAGCVTRYRPVRPTAGQADDLRVEVVELTGGGDVVLRAVTGAGARVRHAYLASPEAVPCSGGTELAGVGVGGPFRELDLHGDTVLTLTPLGALQTPRAGADLDLSLGETAAGCLRVPLARDDGELRWASSHGWSLVGTLAIAPNYAPDRSASAWTVSLAPRLWLGRLQVGATYHAGTLLCDTTTCGNAVLAGGPVVGARLLRTTWWALDADVAYEVGGIQSVGFVHGPRVSLSLLRSKRPRTAAFDPELFFAAFGLEVAGGFWIRSTDPAPWYLSLGPTVTLGP